MSRPWSPPLRETGFTLVEMMVALLIFGLLAAAGVALLSFSVRAQDLAGERFDRIAEVRRAGALLAGDLAQAAPRIVRDEAGSVRAAFEGGSGEEGALALALVRRGWDNFDGAPRPSLQKVQYLLVGDRLQRRAYRFLDGADAMEPITLLSGVRSLRLRYRDRAGGWHDRWDPSDITALPRAVEVISERDGEAAVRQLFIVGTGA